MTKLFFKGLQHLSLNSTDSPIPKVPHLSLPSPSTINPMEQLFTFLAQYQALSEDEHLEEIERLNQLRNSGALTEKEFTAEKKKILG